MWDLYDRNEVKTGQSITKRFDNIPAGSFHIVVETLVKHTDGTYLVMQRDTNKKNHPGSTKEVRADPSSRVKVKLKVRFGKCLKKRV